MKRVMGCWCVLLLSTVIVDAQERPESGTDARKTVAAVRVVNDVIRVDGRLDEPAWQSGPFIDDFVQKEPIEGVPATESMQVRFRYDDGALYVGARMFKKPGASIQAPMGRRDRGEQAEHVLVAFDTFRDARTAYVFGVTAAGVRIDRYHPRDDEDGYDEGFDPVWQARTNVDAQGWTAELWIPFSQLRFNEEAQNIWGLNVHRFTPTLNEHDYWEPVPRTITAWSSRFGVLTGIAELRSTKRVEFLPYFAGASTVNSNRAASNPFDDGRNLNSRGGADLKVGIGPSLTLDATFNPDFGQVEGDPAEVNLSGSETFFAEKRPFFTEGAGLLTLAEINHFFYPRRIGGRPTGPAAGEFVDYPQARRILGAGKVTGRLSSGTSIGLLAAVTGEEAARVFNSASPSIAEVRVAPRTAYGLGRVQQEFGRNASTVSAMATMVHRDLPDGDPLASLFVRRATAVAGDSNLRFMGGQFEIASYGGGTFVEGDPAALARVQRSSSHYLQSPDRNYSKYDPTRSSMAGFKAGTEVRRTGGTHWIWSVSQDNESPGFEPNDIGRLGFGDAHGLRADLRYRQTVPGKVFRGYWLGVNQNNQWNFDGVRVSRTAQIYTNQTWKNFWTTQVSYTRQLLGQNPQLTRGGPLMESPPGWTANVQVRGNQVGQTIWRTEGNFTGNEDGGAAQRFIGTLSFRPGPQWQLSIAPNLLRQIDTQQYISTLDGGRPETYGSRYVLGKVDRSTYAIQFRLGYTLKPDLNVDVYAEPFAASGRFTDLGELALPSTRQRLLYGTGGTTATRQPDNSLVVVDGPKSFTIPNNDFNVHSFRSNVVLRWEYRPGSTIYLVWQQDRMKSEALSSRVSLVDPFRSLTAPGTSYFVIKTSFWLSPK